MRYWIMTLAVMMCFSLTMCACSQHGDEPTNEEVPTPTPEPKPEPTDGNVLVAYFSCTNTTKDIAYDIADITGGTMFRIEPEIPYTPADLDYNSDCRANREQNDATARPEIKDNIKSIADYDIIFLGYPIWWGQAPKIIYTFLESHDFTGKTIVPFCTSHSSGLGSSASNLHSLAPEANWKDGMRFGSSTSKSTIKTWIENMNLNFSKNTGTFPLEDAQNGTAPTVRLSSGYDMPVVGLGTYSLTGDICVNSVKSAIAAGFRKIDTAHIYGNEEEVGLGVREAGVPREEIFVATKLYPNQYSNPETAIEECLRKLDIGYIDLMLLHHPGADDVKAYKAMEKYVAEGKIRSLGVSCSSFGFRD